MGFNLYMYFKLATLFQNIKSCYHIPQCYLVIGLSIIRGRCGRDNMVGGFTTTTVNPGHCKVYSIQLYLIKLVSDLWLIGDFVRALPFLHQ